MFLVCILWCFWSLICTDLLFKAALFLFKLISPELFFFNVIDGSGVSKMHEEVMREIHVNGQNVDS